MLAKVKIVDEGGTVLLDAEKRTEGLAEIVAKAMRKNHQVTVAPLGFKPKAAKPAPKKK